MVHSLRDHPRLWSIILAGNEPSPLDPFVTLWQGFSLPKHFCTFAGTRSLLQHTWDLADQLSHPENRVTVVTQSFLHQTCRQFGGRVPGLIATEPFHNGTLPSALLGVAAVRAQDPQATLVLYPSRSFIHPESQFLQTVHRVTLAEKLLRDHVVLFGVQTDFASGKFGWLCTKEQLEWTSGLPVLTGEISCTSTVSPIKTSVPVPSISLLSNSGIVLSTVEALWKFSEMQFPGIHEHLETVGLLTGQPEKQHQKTLAFHHLPSGCFWKDFLSHIPQHLGMVQLQGVQWSDWEDPAHITDTLALLGKLPAFPVHGMHDQERAMDNSSQGRGNEVMMVQNPFLNQLLFTKRTPP